MSGVAAAMAALPLIKQLLPDAKRIESELRKIAQELDLNCRGSNTYMSYDFGSMVMLSELSTVAQFAASLPDWTGVKVFAPLGADAEYFDRLKIGLKKLKDSRN
jgi:hypothetical protein